MEARTLGDSDFVLSRLGCGAWAIGGSGWEFAWGEQDDRDSIAAARSRVIAPVSSPEAIGELPPGDFRSRRPEFHEPDLSRNLDLVERLRTVGWRYDRRPGEVAIAWVLRNPSITGAIVGVRNARQAEQIMRAAELTLTADDVAEVEGVASLAAR